MAKTLALNLFVVIALFAAAETLARAYWEPAVPRGLARAWTVHNVIDALEWSEGDNAARGGVLPLAGLARTDTFLCREGSASVVYEADRFGFHNPDAVWETNNPALVLIGDSFVHGHCLAPESHFVARIRDHAKEAGFASVVNLGLRGSGPFSQLGVLREYALKGSRRPGKIVWFLLANDLLYDIERELSQPKLVDYLDGKIQSLADRQQEVDARLAELGARRPAPRRPLLSPPVFPETLSRWMFALLTPQPTRALTEGDPEREIPRRNAALFAEILASGAKAGREAGSDVEFVLIPDSWFFTERYGARVRGLVASLKSEMSSRGLTLHDPTAELDASGRPLANYVALDGYYGHFSERGSNLFAKWLTSGVPLGPRSSTSAATGAHLPSPE